MMLAEQGRCPFCGQRLVNTIDHHLPKAYFPELVVTPINMIPSCSDCNKLKLDRVAQRPEDVLLHPYFDTVNDVTWLYAQLLETSPPGLFFFVDGPKEWDDPTNARVRNHFAALKLNELYAATAADELFSIRYLLGEMWHHSGKVTVREYLLECAESAGRHRLNGWKRAAYQAWAGNDWFCDGGFEALE